MYPGLITQVEYEDMWKTNTGETRAKKTRALEDEDQTNTAKAKPLQVVGGSGGGGAQRGIAGR